MLILFLQVSLGLSACINLAVGIWVIRRINEPTALPFAISQFGSAAWALFYGLDVFSAEISEKIFFSTVRLALISVISPCWYLWIRRFTLPDKPLGRIESLFLWLYTLGQLPFILTMTHHNLYMHDFSLSTWNGIRLLQYKVGDAQKVFVLWATLIQFGNLALLGNMVMVSSQAFDRRRALFIIIVTLLILIPNQLFMMGLSPIPGYNFTPHLLVVTGLGCAWILYRYRALELLPFARRIAFSSLAEGLVA